MSHDQGYEPFVSYEGLEQLHRFIFVMAITHVSYSCLTMLLAIVKVRMLCDGSCYLHLYLVETWTLSCSYLAIGVNRTKVYLWLHMQFKTIWLVTIDQIHSWRKWEDEAHMDRHDILLGTVIVIQWWFTTVSNFIFHKWVDRRYRACHTDTWLYMY